LFLPILLGWIKYSQFYFHMKKIKKNVIKAYIFTIMNRCFHLFHINKCI
jgi:hypothetical protein